MPDFSGGDALDKEAVHGLGAVNPPPLLKATGRPAVCRQQDDGVLADQTELAAQSVPVCMIDTTASVSAGEHAP